MGEVPLDEGGETAAEGVGPEMGETLEGDKVLHVCHRVHLDNRTLLHATQIITSVVITR